MFFTHERITGEHRLQFLANVAFCLAVRLADQILTSLCSTTKVSARRKYSRARAPADRATACAASNRSLPAACTPWLVTGEAYGRACGGVAASLGR